MDSEKVFQAGGIGERGFGSTDGEQELLNSMGVGFSKFLPDRELTMIWANDCYFENTGYTREEYGRLFKNTMDYFEEYREDFEKISYALRSALDHGDEKYSLVCKMPVKKGGFRYVRIAGTVKKDPGNGRLVVYSTFMDIGDVIGRAQQEQEKLETGLKDALGKAREANLAKSDFLSRMSHDIRTPMNAIVGMTQLAMECPGNPERTRDCLKKIKLSADVLLNLLNDVLDMAKIENGRTKAAKRVFDIRSLIRHLTMVFEILAGEKKVSFQTDISGQLALFYEGDEPKVERILTNLLGNAVKYTHGGDSIRLSVSSVFRAGGFEEVAFSVTDTGIGIDPEMMPRLFEPFERSETGEEDYLGSGLGLAIAQKYAAILGGMIEVESKPGEGSSFTLKIPMARADGHAPEEEKTDNTGQTSGLEGRRVLLVEDNMMNQEIAQCLLESRGFCVDTADNGAEGVEKFKDNGENYYHAVLMDIQMPVMNGLEAIRVIRGLPRKDAPAVPIIAMSANSFAEDIEKSLSAGANVHITKPFEIEDLVKAIEKF